MSFALAFSGVICDSADSTRCADVNCQGVGAEETSFYLGEQLGVMVRAAFKELQALHRIFGVTKLQSLHEQHFQDLQTA